MRRPFFYSVITASPFVIYSDYAIIQWRVVHYFARRFTFLKRPEFRHIRAVNARNR